MDENRKRSSSAADAPVCTKNWIRLDARSFPKIIFRHNGDTAGTRLGSRQPLSLSETYTLKSGTQRHGSRRPRAFRHGLRASELCSLRWDQVDLAHARLHVSRLKSGIPSVHPLTGTELRALRRLQREQEPGRYLFLSERGAPMSAVGFRRMI